MMCFWSEVTDCQLPMLTKPSHPSQKSRPTTSCRVMPMSTPGSGSGPLQSSCPPILADLRPYQLSSFQPFPSSFSWVHFELPPWPSKLNDLSFSQGVLLFSSQSHFCQELWPPLPFCFLYRLARMVRPSPASLLEGGEGPSNTPPPPSSLWLFIPSL